MKRFIILAAIAAMLAGCASNNPPPAEQQAINQLKTITGDAQLCQALETVNKTPEQYGGNIATMPREAFDIYYAQQQYLNQQIAARGLECEQVNAKATRATQTAAAELNPEQKQKRAAYACDAYANRAQFANPSALVEMCRRGYTASAPKCKRDMSEFNHRAQTLNGAARAEYVELGNAFRAGCNLK